MKAALSASFTYPCGCKFDFAEGDEIGASCPTHGLKSAVGTNMQLGGRSVVPDPEYSAGEYVLSIRLDSMGRLLVLAKDGWCFDRDQTIELAERVQELVDEVVGQAP